MVCEAKSCRSDAGQGSDPITPQKANSVFMVICLMAGRRDCRVVVLVVWLTIQIVSTLKTVSRENKRQWCSQWSAEQSRRHPLFVTRLNSSVITGELDKIWSRITLAVMFLAPNYNSKGGLDTPSLFQLLNNLITSSWTPRRSGLRNIDLTL